MRARHLFYKKIWVVFTCILSLMLSPCSKAIDPALFLPASSKNKGEALKDDTLDTPVTLKMHRVGRGNAVTMSVGKGDEREYMLVDVGSSGYTGELVYSNQSLEEGTPPSSPRSPPSTPRALQGSVTPQSISRSPNYEALLGQAEKEKGFKFPTTPQQPILELRKTFLEGKISSTANPSKILKTPIHVKTVVITHPDADHYRWLTKLFFNPKDKIDHLILGGQPNHYYNGISESGRKLELGIEKFEGWLNERFLTNPSMKVYFPAIGLAGLSATSSVLEAMGVEKKTTKGSTYNRKELSTHGPKVGPSIHDEPGQPTNSFKEAFDFGETVKISALTVNPMHNLLEKRRKGRSKEEKGKEITENEYYSQSDPDNDNHDSLVLKISNGESSAILTGDATALTTNRILANYYGEEEFLKTNILLASHHGSATHGSNNKQWIKTTNPEYVIISNGHDGHPQPEAYENFKQSSRLRNVRRHEVLVGGKTSKAGIESGFLHETVRGIFSTLNSGSVTVELYKDGTIALETVNNGKFVNRKKLSSVNPQTPDLQIIEVDLSKSKTLKYESPKSTPRSPYNPPDSPYNPPDSMPQEQDKEKEREKEEKTSQPSSVEAGEEGGGEEIDVEVLVTPKESDQVKPKRIAKRRNARKKEEIARQKKEEINRQKETYSP